MLNEEQVRKLFDELRLPRRLARRGSPINIHCPYHKLHSPSRDQRPSCRLYFDCYPHLYCLHVSCYEELQELNTYLRLLITGTTDFPETNRTAEPAGDYAYARMVARKLPKILAKFRPRQWPHKPIEMSVPAFLKRLGVWKRADRIWIGNERDSGSPKYGTHFRTLVQWQKTPPPLSWSFVCGCTFEPGTFSRSNANVRAHRILILESDALPPIDTAAVAKWIEKSFTLPLLALVYSGGKSLHCYFEHPGQEWLGLYRPTLVAVGFCAGSLRNPSQPMRLANQVRAENAAVQHLLWIRK
jgi:hypothetical protein